MEVLKKFTDAELLFAIKSPSTVDDAIRFMYREYYTLLKTYICHNSGGEEDAQDIFQEVLVAFIDLVQKEKYREESTIKTLMYSLNRNIWLNELKKRNSAKKRNNYFEMEKDIEIMDVSHYIAHTEMQKQTMAILEKLGDICKKILMAFYYENMSMKEILIYLNYENEQVVRNKKYKCLKQLEQMFVNNPQLALSLKSSLNYG